MSRVNESSTYIEGTLGGEDTMRGWDDTMGHFVDRDSRGHALHCTCTYLLLAAYRVDALLDLERFQVIKLGRV